MEECRKICTDCYYANWDCEGSSQQPVEHPHMVFDSCDKETRPYFDPFDGCWKCGSFKEFSPYGIE